MAWDAAYDAEVDSSMWDVDFSSAFDNSNANVFSFNEEEETDGLNEFQKKAQKATEAAAKALAKLSLTEKELEAEIQKRKIEAAREKERLLALRAGAEAELLRLREQAAKTRAEALQDAATEQEEKKEAGKLDFIKQHAARAKERSKELKRLEDEEAKKKGELEKLAAEELKQSIRQEKDRKMEQQRNQKVQQEIADTMAKIEHVKLRKVDPNAMFQEFQAMALRAQMGARKSMLEQEAAEALQMQRKAEELEKYRREVQERQEKAAEMRKQKELELAQLREEANKAREALQRSSAEEMTQEQKATMTVAEFIKQHALAAKERAKELKRLEMEENRRKLELEAMAKEEKARQTAEERRMLREKREKEENDKVAAAAQKSSGPSWLSIGKKKLAAPKPAPVREDDGPSASDLLKALKPKRGKSIRFQMDPEWNEGALSRPGRALVRLRKFKHLIFAPEDMSEQRDCVLAIFTDMCAICKLEKGGALRLLLRPTDRASVYAELCDKDPNVIVMQFAANPPIYLLASSPVEAQYWLFLLPKP